MTKKHLFWFLFGLLFLSALRLLVIITNTLDLAPDEAYYWEWSKRLDWSYYSKGPLVALLIRGSCEIFGDTALAVRLPALLCQALASVVFFCLVSRYSGSFVALFAWLFLQSMLLVSASGFTMTTDAPMVLFWLLSINAALKATRIESSVSWIFAMFFAAIACWAKYTSVVLPLAYTLYLLFSAKHRSQLLSLSFLSGIAVFTVGILPMVIWNQQHHWVNFMHNAGHLTNSKGSSLRPQYLPELLAGQLALIGPLTLPILLFGIKRAWTLRTKLTSEINLLLWTILPLAVLCVGVSLTRRVYANWPLPLHISGLILAALLYRLDDSFADKIRPFLKPAFISSLAITLLAHLPLYGVTFGLPAEILTTKKLVGWHDLGMAVKKEFEKPDPTRRDQSPQFSFVLTDRYDIAASIAFYANLPGKVYLAKSDDRRMTQYDIWGGWKNLQGHNAILVLPAPEIPSEISSRFSSISPIAPQPNAVTSYSGSVLRSMYFFNAVNYDGAEPILPKAY